MREYVKPEFYVKNFTVDQTVAACEPYDEAQPVKVICAIASGDKDNVFYDKCENNADTTGILKNGTDYRDLDGDGDNTDNIQYFIWYDGERNGQPDDIGVKLIAELGVASGGHAGWASPNILSIVNHS